MMDSDLSKETQPDPISDAPLQVPSQAYERLAEWLGAILEITDELLSADSKESEAAINRSLARTGALAGSDRTYVFSLRAPDRLDNTHEWTAPGIEPMIAQLQDMSARHSSIRLSGMS